jgi:hypothetical protein
MIVSAILVELAPNDRRLALLQILLLLRAKQRRCVDRQIRVDKRKLSTLQSNTNNRRCSFLNKKTGLTRSGSGRIINKNQASETLHSSQAPTNKQTNQPKKKPIRGTASFPKRLTQKRKRNTERKTNFITEQNSTPKPSNIV